MNTEAKLVNEIFRKFHSIDNRKHVLLYFLTTLNEIQNSIAVLKIENNSPFEVVSLESRLMFITEKTLDILDHVIIELQNVVQMYQELNSMFQKDVQELFQERFSSFINDVSSLSTLFLHDIFIVRQLFYKFKLMAHELKRIIDFHIEIEVKF
jgi:archaellum component FlaC